MNQIHLKRGMAPAIAVTLLLSVLACTFGVGPITISLGPPSPTPTETRTPRPTITPIPTATETPTPTPTDTATPQTTATATRRLPTPRPPTPRPPTAGPPPISPPTVSPFEYHANSPLPCAHSGIAFLKGTVYLDKNDLNSKYVGAIVALGPPDGSRIYDVIKTDSYGEYTFVLGDAGQPKPGNWGIWLVDPSLKRKSDIGGPIVTNGLPASDPTSCWSSGVDFWK